MPKGRGAESICGSAAWARPAIDDPQVAWLPQSHGAPLSALPR
ncbi:hypothetical protein SRB17_71140 [Streptomyces sp. RB17]|nr:hypothetical protein [Streptomyces sp. RB17]